MKTRKNGFVLAMTCLVIILAFFVAPLSCLTLQWHPVLMVLNSGKTAIISYADGVAMANSQNTLHEGDEVRLNVLSHDEKGFSVIAIQEKPQR